MPSHGGCRLKQLVRRPRTATWRKLEIQAFERARPNPVDRVPDPVQVSLEQIPVVRRQNNEGDFPLGHVLLIPDVLVAGDHGVEAFGLRRAYQVSVRQLGPTQLVSRPSLPRDLGMNSGARKACFGQAGCGARCLIA